MKLYMREKIFTWKDQFFVLDEYGGNRYRVEGELFSWGKKLHVYYPSGVEAAFVRQKLWTFLPRYEVFVGEQKTAEIVKEMTLFRPRYTIEGLGWTVEGDFWSHEYTILNGSYPVVTISKEWMTWGDSYLLDVRDERAEIPALAVVLAIDCIAEASRNNS